MTFDVALADRNVIVRTNARAEVFAHTARNLAILGDLGPPVPRVLAADSTGTRYPFSYMILAEIPGRDLRYEVPAMGAAQMTRLVAQIVGYQRLVATLPPGQGFGWVAFGESGRFSSWWDLIQAELIDRIERDGDGTLADLSARLGRAIDRCEPALRAVPPTCFLDDVTIKNVIMEHGELQGLIDVDVVCYGDPLFQIALTAAGVVSDVGREALFYVEELCRLWSLSGEQRRLVWLYAANFGLEFLQRMAHVETSEWEQRMVGTVGAWLALVEE